MCVESYHFIFIPDTHKTPRFRYEKVTEQFASLT